MTARLHQVIVWGEATGDHDLPVIMSGTMMLTDAERARLDRQLYGMMGEDYLSAYEIEPIETQPAITPETILAAIVEQLVDEDHEGARSQWMMLGGEL